MKNPTRVKDTGMFDRIQANNGTAARNNSQMDRIITSLVLGSTKNTRTDEERLEAANKRYNHLSELRVRVARMHVALADLYTLQKPQQLRLLTAARKALDEMLSQPQPVGVGKLLKACANELTSTREGIYVGASADRKTMTLIMTAKALEGIDALRSQAELSISKYKAVLADASGGGGLDDKMEETIRRNRTEQTKLPDITKEGAEKDWAVARVAIIPLLKSPMPAEVMVPAMEKQGFRTDNLAGYTAIHNQLVIGINTGKLAKKTKSGDAVHDVLKKVERAMGQKLLLVSDQAKGAKGASWYWVMTQKEMDRMLRVFPNKQMQLRSWGFAF